MMKQHIFSLGVCLFIVGLLPVLGQETDNRTRFSEAQKQHAKVYYQIALLVQKGQYDFDKTFRAFYAPIANDCERLYKEHKKYENYFRQKANESMEKSKQEMAKKQEKARLCYKQLADLTQTIIEAYKKQESSKLGASLKEYKQIETTLNSLGAKFPVRNWVTVSEAELLISQSIRNNQARKQPHN